MPGKQKKPRVTRREKKTQVDSLIQNAKFTKVLMMKELMHLEEYHSEGLDLVIEYLVPDLVKREDWDQIFNLLKVNMQDYYEKSSWGWDENKKKEELTDKTAAFLIARNSDGKILGFSHYRFETKNNHNVLYCYELLVAEKIRNKGVGKYLMNLLFLIAFRFKFIKVMVTVFTHNKPALDFFKKSLGFRRDETSPSEEKDKCFEILSQSIDKSFICDVKNKLHINRFNYYQLPSQ